MLRRFLLIAGLIAFGAPAAEAQLSASGSVSIGATVLSPIAVTAGQTLTFGKTGQNTTKTVAPDDAGSGRFIVTGTGGADFTLTLTLPTDLTKGGDNLPIGSWTGKHGNTADAPGGSAFTPTSGATQPYTFPGTGSAEVKYFRVGATVTAGAAQAPGDYTGTITIDVAYTGI